MAVPSWPHFPQGARRLGEGLGLCREASLQDWGWMRGQALVAQSLMDLAGSLGPIAQTRTLRPKVTPSAWGSPRDSPAWPSADPHPIYSPSHLEQGGQRAGAGTRPTARASSVCLMSSQLLTNICSVSHPGTICHPSCSASLYSFLSFSVSLRLPLSSLAHSLSVLELVISALSTGQGQTLQFPGPGGGVESSVRGQAWGLQGWELCHSLTGGPELPSPHLSNGENSSHLGGPLQG